MIETILWGCKIGDPDYMEDVLYKYKGYVNKEELLNHVTSWAEKNNYDRLRIAVIDLSIKPNFIKTINK
jgi:hypothetical protein